jgi:hypothetical protein
MSQHCTQTSDSGTTGLRSTRPIRFGDQPSNGLGGGAPSEEPPEPDSPPAQPPIGFGNPEALRAAYLPAALSAFLSSVPLVSLLCFIWYPAAGFLAVHLYNRRNRGFLDSGGGARLGALTGVFSFVITLVLMTIGSLFVGEGGFAQALRKAVEENPMRGEMMDQVLPLLENPLAIALILLVGLGLTFMLSVGFSAIGGALGARVLRRD